MEDSPRRRRVTSSDVARESGVSRTTVSYVLNQAPGQTIPEATRRRVLEAAARLGYTPAGAARSLHRGRSDLILGLLPDWPIGQAIGQMLADLSRELDRRGLMFVIYPARCDVLGASQIWRAIGPVAVLSLDAVDDTVAETLRRHGIAVIELVYGIPRRRPTLHLPNRRIGEIQVEHLHHQGHSRLGYADSDDPRITAFRDARLGGVRAACEDLELPEPVTNPVRLNPDAAERAIRRWRAADPPITGICAYNDDVALAVLAGLRKLHLSAPADLAVIGVDDIPAAICASPPLTTVTIDLQLYADYIAETVLRTLNGRPPGRHPGVETVRVIPRAST